MKKHRIFAVGDYVHVLLSSYNHPNVLIPVRGIVKEAKWDDVSPVYLIKIVKFYDSIKFLKKYLFEMNFVHKMNDRPRRFRLKDEEFKSTREIEERLNRTDEKRFYVIVDSFMATKTREDLREVFNNIQYFFIGRRFKELKELMTRAFYTGNMRLDSHAEFEMRLRKFMTDIFENDEKLVHFMSSLS